MCLILNDIIQIFAQMKERKLQHCFINENNLYLINGMVKLGGLEFLEPISKINMEERQYLKFSYLFDDVDYLPPEVLVRKIFTLNMNLFSLGVFIYRLLYNRYPFEGKFNGSKDLLLMYQNEVCKLEFPEASVMASLSSHSLLSNMAFKFEKGVSSCRQSILMTELSKNRKSGEKPKVNGEPFVKKIEKDNSGCKKTNTKGNQMQIMETTWRKLLIDLLRVNSHDRININELKHNFKDIFDLLGITNLFTLRKSLTENINSNFLKNNLKINQGSNIQVTKTSKDDKLKINKNQTNGTSFRQRGIRKNKFIDQNFLEMTTQEQCIKNVSSKEIPNTGNFFPNESDMDKSRFPLRTMKYHQKNFQPKNIGYSTGQ